MEKREEGRSEEEEDAPMSGEEGSLDEAASDSESYSSEGTDSQEGAEKDGNPDGGFCADTEVTSQTIS